MGNHTPRPSSRMSSAAGSTRRPARTAEQDLRAAVAGLSAEDIAILRSGVRYPGQQKSDRELALELAEDEARAFAMFESDHALAINMSRQDDGIAPRPTPAAPPRPAPGARPNGSSGGGFWSFLTSTSRSAATTPSQRRTENPTTPPVTLPASNPPLEPLTGHNCVICMDPIRGVEIRAPCGDYYDKACILDLFTAATRDESLFPPRCCRQQIPLESVQRHMTAELGNLFKLKTEEFSTLKRIYCVRQSCSRFLGPQIEKTLTWFFWPMYKCPAPGCGTETCSWCKKEAIFGHYCSNHDDNDRRVLALARAQGWSRCPGCEQIIELNHGCFHMTCRCRTEFCYLCRARWKSCACPQWDERRLLVAAEARADAELRQAAELRPAAVRVNPVVPARPAQVVPPPARLVQAARATVPAPAPVRQVPAIVPARPTANPVRPAAPGFFAAHTRDWVEGQRLTVRTPTATPAAQRPSATTRPTAPGQTETAARQTLNVTTARDLPFPRTTQAQAPTAAIPRNPLGTSCNSQAQPRPRSTYVAKNATPPDRATLVQTWMDRLRVDHDCRHEVWQYRRGAGRCESCHDKLPIYLLRCTGCEMLACRRCRHNRL